MKVCAFASSAPSSAFPLRTQRNFASATSLKQKVRNMTFGVRDEKAPSLVLLDGRGIIVPLSTDKASRLSESYDRSRGNGLFLGFFPERANSYNCGELSGLARLGCSCDLREFRNVDYPNIGFFGLEILNGLFPELPNGLKRQVLTAVPYYLLLQARNNRPLSSNTRR